MPCSLCPEVGGVRREFKLVDPYEHPESFWREDSYWRHMHEAHWLECAIVQRWLDEYLRGLLPVDLRIMLHLGDCKECHRRVLAMIGSGAYWPPQA